MRLDYSAEFLSEKLPDGAYSHHLVGERHVRSENRFRQIDAEEADQAKLDSGSDDENEREGLSMVPTAPLLQMHSRQICNSFCDFATF